MFPPEPILKISRDGASIAARFGGAGRDGRRF